jgi:hypothetical protein
MCELLKNITEILFSQHRIMENMGHISRFSKDLLLHIHLRVYMEALSVTPNVPLNHTNLL